MYTGYINRLFSLCSPIRQYQRMIISQKLVCFIITICTIFGMAISFFSVTFGRAQTSVSSKPICKKNEVCEISPNFNGDQSINFLQLSSLSEYKEPTITSSNIPNGNPFGGEAYDSTYITCVRHCINYLSGIGLHQGMDLVPNNSYYDNNEASKRAGGKAIVFATCNGTAKAISTSSSGNQVLIACNELGYAVQYFHLENQLIGDEIITVESGQPIGIMGNTGIYTSGAHLHYQINFGCMTSNSECTLDPRGFISPKDIYNCLNCL
jgi:hypothetical protein